MFSRRFSWQVIMLYLLLIACDTCSQVFFKSASAGLIEPQFDNWQHFFGFIKIVAVQPEIAMGIFSLMIAFVCWMLLIRHNDLSKAHLVSCFVYATVPTASMIVFGEHIAMRQLVGIAFITLGALIAGTT